MKKCRRKDCFAYKTEWGNNCVALGVTYSNDCDCKFYKNKKEYEAYLEETKKQKKRETTIW